MHHQETIHYAIAPSRLSHVLVAQSAKGVAAVLLGHDPAAMFAELQTIFPRAILQENEREMDKTVARVLRYIEDQNGGLDIPLDIRGTDFEKKVWHALCAIPAGKTMSYSQIAHSVNLSGAARAVGSACGRNILAMIIPCHRAVRSDGALSGYRWGVELKRAILMREA